MSNELEPTIRRLKALNVDTISLVFYEFQTSELTSDIHLNYSRYSADPIAIERAITVIHQSGLKVLLKPHIGLNNNQFRGIIKPSAAYFAAYKKYIYFWADVARKKNVHAFCVGAELKGLERSTAFWREVVAGSRSRFGGLITYGTWATCWCFVALLLWSVCTRGGEELDQVPWSGAGASSGHSLLRCSVFSCKACD